jgi:hypothetical protein
VKRAEFEHVIKAAAHIVKDEIVVVGSQSVLGGFPDAPPSLLRSQEVDVYPRSEPERAQEIDGAIGDGSMFHSTYGYYAYGVGPETIKAPAGWEARLERLELPAISKKDGTVVGWCIEVHDLVLAKARRRTAARSDFRGGCDPRRARRRRQAPSWCRPSSLKTCGSLLENGWRG